MKIKQLYSSGEKKELAEKLYELAILQKQLYLKDDSAQEEIVLYEMSIVILKLTYASFSSVVNYESINSEGIEDIVQDSACTIYEKFKTHEFDPEQSQFKVEAIISFIKNIIKGKYLNYNKSRNIQKNNLVSIESWGNENDRDSSQFDKIASKENIEADLFYEQSINNLCKNLLLMAKDDKEKKYIDLLFIQRFTGNDMSKKEIAQILGCSSAYVIKKEKQLLAKFKNNLNKDDYF